MNPIGSLFGKFTYIDPEKDKEFVGLKTILNSKPESLAPLVRVLDWIFYGFELKLPYHTTEPYILKGMLAQARICCPRELIKSIKLCN